MKLFLDTNVIIDALVNRNESHAASKLLLSLGYVKEFDLWVSPSQWTDMFYILSDGGRKSQRERAAQVLKELRKCVRVSTLGESEVDGAMALGWPDVEDALVYTAANTKSPVALITRNKADFLRSEIPLFTCEEFFEWLRTEHGIVYDETEV